MEQDTQKWIEQNYVSLYSRLTQIAYHLTGDTVLAEDLVQDVFLLALLHPEKLENHPNREGWLVVSLRNLIKNEEQHMRQHEISLEGFMELFGECEKQRLSDVLPNGLTEQEHKILIWYYEEERNHREIANHLGISEGACRLRVFRAKEHCAVLLKAEKDGRKQIINDVAKTEK